MNYRDSTRGDPFQGQLEGDPEVSDDLDQLHFDLTLLEPESLLVMKGGGETGKYCVTQGG